MAKKARTSLPPAAAPASTAAGACRDRPWIVVTLALLLTALIVGAYVNTLRVPLLLDDTDSIIDNPSIRSWRTALFPPSGSGVTVSGRPVLNASLAINHALGGEEPAGYHAGNLVIHTLAGLALFGVVRRTLRQPGLADRFGPHATLLAFFIAALWSLHPLQTESVTYIIQRAESLVGLFYLLTFYTFIRSTQPPTSRLWPVLSVSFCVLGMASKEVMASAPLVMFVYDALFISGSFSEAWRRHRKLHLGLASTWLLLGGLILSTAGRGGSVGFASTTVSWWEYALTQATAIVRYLWLSLWPADLVFDYGSFIEKSAVRIVPSSLAVLALVAATILAWRRKSPLALAGVWFFAILAPSSSIIPIVTQTIAEHRMYLPLAAVIALVVLLLWRLPRPFALSVLAVLPLLAAYATYQRNRLYQSPIALWEDVLAKRPAHDRACSNLGSALVKADRISEGIYYHEKAVGLNPRDAKNHSNLGLAYSKAGRNREALATLEQAIGIAPRQAIIRINYGNALLTAGRVAESIEQLRLALELSPGNGEAHFNLANALAAAGRGSESLGHYEAALKANPRDVEALTNLGAELARLGRIDEAVARYQTALQINPDSGKTHNNLGIAYMMTGRAEQALPHFRDAVRLAPNLPQARHNLGGALAETGRREEAIAQMEILLTMIQPTADLYNNLGVLNAQLDRLTAAGDCFKKALAIDPAHTGAAENLSRLEAYLRSQRTP